MFLHLAKVGKLVYGRSACQINNNVHEACDLNILWSLRSTEEMKQSGRQKHQICLCFCLQPATILWPVWLRVFLDKLRLVFLRFDRSIKVSHSSRFESGSRRPSGLVLHYSPQTVQHTALLNMNTSLITLKCFVFLCFKVSIIILTQGKGHSLPLL